MVDEYAKDQEQFISGIQWVNNIDTNLSLHMIESRLAAYNEKPIDYDDICAWQTTLMNGVSKLVNENKSGVDHPIIQSELGRIVPKIKFDSQIALSRMSNHGQTQDQTSKTDSREDQKSSSSGPKM